MNARVKSALVAGLLFFIVSHPFVYQIVDRVTMGVFGNLSGPSTMGSIVQSLVFAVVAYFAMHS